MGYNAEDENLFSKKNKITLERYTNLINEYKTVVRNYNGILRILDNPTASAYPYQNIKKSSTNIDKKYRDKKYISIDNESTYNKTITTYNEESFDVTPGYYKISLISGGSGGLVLYGNHSNRCAECSGCSGSLYELIIYIPQTGSMKVKVGKGGSRIIRSDFNIGKWDRQVAPVAGEASYVYFNNVLIAKCRGGSNVQYVFRSHDHDGDIEHIDVFSDEENILGNYIVSVEKSIGNKLGTFGEKGNKNYQASNPVSSMDEYKNYGVGGAAQAKNNNIDDIKSVTTNGTGGYFRIQSMDSEQKYGYIKQTLNLESNVIHTLGNENIIREKFDEVLKKIYKKLSPTTRLVEDSCNIIGEETNESTSAKKYSELKSELEKNPLNVDLMKNNKILMLSEVKTTKQPGCRPVDSYVLTYDRDTLRKLPISNDDFSINGMYGTTYQPYYYGNDIIYIKELKPITEIYKYQNGSYEQVGTARYDENPKELLVNSNEGNKVIVKNIQGSGYTIYATIVGAGGGGGGGSWADRWKTHGGAGGSGGLLKGTFHISSTNSSASRNLYIHIGKGGTGGSGQRKAGSPGQDGEATTIGLDSQNFAIAGGGKGGEGSKKKNNYPAYPNNGAGGTNSYLASFSPEIEKNVNGNGEIISKVDWWGTVQGMPSVYSGQNYGAGGTSAPKTSGENGKDGYANVYIQEDRKLIYNNHEYKPYNGTDVNSNVILWSHYEYDLQKLNRLKEYVKSKDSWFDSDGYCQRSCQINCQTSVQKS